MSGEAEVKLKFVSDEKALATMEKRLESLANKLDQVQKKGKGAGEGKMPVLQPADPSAWSQATAGITGYLAQAVVVSKVIDMIGAGVNAIGDANAKWQDQLSGMDKRLEKMQARVVLQSGGTDKSARDTVRTAAESAMDVPALGETLEDYVSAQVYLEGSSFDKGEVKSGKTLKSMNKVMAGVSAFEGGQEFASSKDAMETLSTLVDAWGKKGTTEDIEHLGTVARGAFKETRMQGGDLKAFGKTAGTFAQFGLTEEESLSRFAATKEGTGSAEETATGMKNYLLRLSDVTPERQAALDELNLKAADVSVEKGGTKIGESIERMKAALSQKSEEDRNRLLAVLFGRESSTPISVMLEKEQRSRAVEAEMGDREEFNATAETFGGLELSERRRRGLRLQQGEAENLWKQGGVSFDELSEERAASTAERRLGARGPVDQVGITIDDKLQETAEDLNKRFGLGPSDKGVSADALGTGGTALLGPLGLMLEALRQIGKNTEKPEPARNRNGNVEPVQAP